MNGSGTSSSQPAARELFLRALDVPPSERAGFVAGACAGNAALEREVLDLLRALGEAGDYLSRPSEERPAGPEPGGAGAGVGERIGPYKLLERIGEGGFGLVYMAEQERPLRRRVALKVIKAGMDSRQVIARFDAERQALALMEHPSIARVFDAGTTSLGKPYFVMELVRGVPITQYCDERRLTPRERLELLVQVCGAVQHAHTKGVIHRDLKPANVLVTLHDGQPVPKVIDFGIAKAIDRPLTDRTVFTEFRAFLGTPAYMSPEQAEMSGLDVDTRSDVYALGVLMYELLTGSTPFDAQRLASAGLGEMQRILREEEPARPSTRLSTLGDRLTGVAERRRTEPSRLSRLLRGDVDWIVMRAMEKDRTRRYETAESLAADIRRYLAGEPVLAGPPGVGYRARRFVSRNRGAVAAGAVIVGALVVGLGASLWGLRQASTERDNARRAEGEQRRAALEADRARDLAQRRAVRAQAAAEVAQVGAQFIDWGLGFGVPGFAEERDVRSRTMPDLVDLCAARAGRIYQGQPRLEAAARYHLGRMYTALGRVEDAGDQLRAAMDLWDRQGLPDEATFVTACSELEFAEYQRAVGPRDGNRLRVRKFAVVLEYLQSEGSRFAAPLAAWGRATLPVPRPDEDQIEAAWNDVLAAWRAGPPARDSDELLLVLDAICTPICKVAIEGRSFAARAAGLTIAAEIGSTYPEQFTRNVECLFMALGLIGAVETDRQQPDRLALSERLLSSNLGAVARDHWIHLYAGCYKGRALIRLGKAGEGEPLLRENCEGLRRARGMRDGYFQDAFSTLLVRAFSTKRYTLLRDFQCDPELPLPAETRQLFASIGLPEFSAAVSRLTAALKALPPERAADGRRLAGAILPLIWNAWDFWLLETDPAVPLIDAVLELGAGPDPASRLAYANWQMLRVDVANYLKDYSTAHRLVAEALSTRSELVGEDNWLVASTRAKQGASLILDGRFEEGERAVLAAYDVLVNTVGANFTDSLLCVRRLAIAWTATGRPALIGDLMERWLARLDDGRDFEPALDSIRRAAWEIVRRPGLPQTEYQRAERALLRVIEKAKSRADDRVWLAMARWRAGNAAQAAHDLRALDQQAGAATRRRSPFALLALAGALHDAGDDDAARRTLADADAAAEANPLPGTLRMDLDELAGEIRKVLAAPVP